MPGKIFVSYRRDDAAGDARGVRDGLVARFGKSNVFMDVDNLLAGQRFDKELAKALTACDVLVAIIGPRWLELLKARIVSEERDYIREEISAALKRGIIVIPARIGREGHMPPLPRPEDLPEDIRDLVLYQKHDITHEHFGRDMTELSEAITKVRGSGAIWTNIIVARGRGVGSLLADLPSSWLRRRPTTPECLCRLLHRLSWTPRATQGSLSTSQRTGRSRLTLLKASAQTRHTSQC